jgi:hypothetical protein
MGVKLVTLHFRINVYSVHVRTVTREKMQEWTDISGQRKVKI